MQKSVKSGQITDPDSLFNYLALDIHRKYFEVGIALHLEYKVLHNELETGFMLMQPDSKKAMRMLQLWREHFGEDNFTYSVLAAALEEQGFRDFADKYCYNVPSTGKSHKYILISSLCIS